MYRDINGIALKAAVSILLFVGTSFAEPADDDGVVNVKTVVKQEMLELQVQVIDDKGKPVANAKITPWALRSSQGHGSWSKDDKGAGIGPTTTVTDAQGNAVVVYPAYRYLDEGIRTISVSLNVDHPEFALIDRLHIDVPHESDRAYVINLQPGIPVELHPTIDGRSADIDNLFLLWSDGRCYQAGAAPTPLPEGRLRIPAMRPGDNSVLLVKFDGERVTHFSQITDFKLTPGETKQIDLPLLPSIRVKGALSPNVPRPIQNGRIKVWTLESADANQNRVSWFTWAPVQPDGTFTIEGWPETEPMQLIALCEGFIATSGRAPESVKTPPDPAKDSFNRPQVFDHFGSEPIEVSMTPLARCEVTLKDGDNKPIAAAKVVSWPNVGWWNGGSQVYCHPLVRCETLVRNRAFFESDSASSNPFEAISNATGKATLELPAGEESLAIFSDVYELPVFLGRRNVSVKLTSGKTTETTLNLQPRGTEKLGEWDKLAGVVFGCSTREGRRICALPSVRKQMDHFAIRFRDAKNRRDPQLLADAYSVVADAFTDVGDLEEAAKWRGKANEQAAKVNAEKPGAK